MIEEEELNIQMVAEGIYRVQTVIFIISKSSKSWGEETSLRLNDSQPHVERKFEVRLTNHPASPAHAFWRRRGEIDPWKPHHAFISK